MFLLVCLCQVQGKKFNWKPSASPETRMLLSIIARLRHKADLMPSGCGGTV